MKKVFNVVFLSIISFLLLFIAAQPKEEVVKATNKINEKSLVTEFKDIKELQSTIEKEEVVLLYVYGDTCPHCNKFKPMLDKMVKKHNAKVYSFNIYNEENSLAMQNLAMTDTYGFGNLMYVPVIMVIKYGQVTGMMGAEQWAIPNDNAELGYDINEKMLDDFFSTDFGK